MNAILEIVLPAFCLIGLGYLVARTNYLSTAVGDALADYVFKLAVPVLLMQSIATADFSGANPWAFVLVYFIGVIAVWAAAMLIIMFVFGRGMRAAVIAGVAAGFSNLVMLGIPLVERAYGQDGLQILLFLVAIHLPVMMATSTFLMEYAVRADGVEQGRLNLKSVARNLAQSLLKNPIIIGIFIGILWRLTGLGISGFPAQIMGLLSQTTGPLLLISLGMGLIKYGIRGNLLAAMSLALLSLLVMPGVVYLVATSLFSLPLLWFKVAILASSCPTGVNAYLIANYFKNAEGLASSSIVIALLGSIVSIPFWLAVVQANTP